MDVQVKFLGAAQSVTGSKYLLSIGTFTVMVDCGMFQGLKELRERNWDEFPVDPATINAVVITHAHIDHTGYLPSLVRQGFNGPVYCTSATAGLAEILLLDAAKLQEEEAAFAAKEGFSKHHPPLPLYYTHDAEQVLNLLRPFEFDEDVMIHDTVRVKFHNAGHILGAALVEMIINGPVQEKTIIFSGDLGRYNHPILRDPVSAPYADILFIESTYGNRDTLNEFPARQLGNVVSETFQHQGCVVIPAFAVGRTQTLIYYLRELMEMGDIPTATIYIDSPMAISVTGLYKKYFPYHKLREQDLENQTSVFDYPQVKYCRSRESSKAINDVKENAIIISASGMCAGGRILHHLIHRLPNENDTLLFVGYQAEGTRGRKILEGNPTIKIFGKQVPVRCHVRKIEGLSGHADKLELLQWVNNFKRPPKKTFVVHGELESATAFAETLTTELSWNNVTVPDYLESYSLFEGI